MFDQKLARIFRRIQLPAHMYLRTVETEGNFCLTTITDEGVPLFAAREKYLNAGGTMRKAIQYSLASRAAYNGFRLHGLEP